MNLTARHFRPKQTGGASPGWIALALAAWVLMTLPGSAPAAQGLQVDRDRNTLDSSGGTVIFSIHFPEAGKGHLILYDLAHRRVRTLMNGMNVKAGIHSVSWSGDTDESGKAGTGQAYYPVVRLEGTSGKTWELDPAFHSGGEPVDLAPMDYRYVPASRVVRFSLSRAARVRIRTGIHGGPLLKTLAEWSPFPAGEHEIPWDGKDETGLIDVAGNGDFSLIIQAYSLPDSSVILQGPARKSTGLAPAKAATGDVSRRSKLQKAMLLSKSPRNAHALDGEALAARPTFTTQFVEPLAVKEGIPVLNRSATVRVALSESTAPEMLRDRFEIIVYVDNQRVFEEEQAYTPYTLEFPIDGLDTGDHTLSVTVASLSDRVATQSSPFRVER